MKASEAQVGGKHYKQLAIQPMQYSMANGLDACQHTAIKYVTRHREGAGKKDLYKALHCIMLLIEDSYEWTAQDSAIVSAITANPSSFFHSGKPLEAATPMAKEDITHIAEECGMFSDGTPDAWDESAVLKFARVIADAERDGCCRLVHPFVSQRIGFDAAEELEVLLGMRSAQVTLSKTYPAASQHGGE